MKGLFILSLLLVCHFLADFTHLSTNWMLKAKRFGKPLFPIFTHSLVHGVLITLASSLFVDQMGILIIILSIETLSHFAIDLWKGRMNVWFPKLQDASNKYHWWIFGIDQFLHTFIIILIYFILIKP